jgi:penicillin-binding protein 1C
LPDIGVTPAQPANVAQTAICWPLGMAAGQHPEHCEQLRVAWVVNDTVPPTLGSGRNPLSLWVDAHSGLRVTPLCAGADVQQRSVALWPAALEPWLPGQQRRSNRIPPLDPRCHEDLALLLAPPRIEGLEDGARLLPSPQSGQLPDISLSASGGVGELQWYVNGSWHYRSKAGQTLRHRFATAGRYEIVVVDAQGQTDRRQLTVERTDLAYH